MTKKSIFVVEDEEDILELIRYNLTREGFLVSTAVNGENAVKAIFQKPPDLILLDLMLPGIDGLEVCRILKKENKTADIPIVMLTARGEESDIITGLELGADDYITKPFSMKVLVARIRAVSRRKHRPSTDKNTVIRIHDLMINPGRHEVLIKDQPVVKMFFTNCPQPSHSHQAVSPLAPIPVGLKVKTATLPLPDGSSSRQVFFEPFVNNKSEFGGVIMPARLDVLCKFVLRAEQRIRLADFGIHMFAIVNSVEV